MELYPQNTSAVVCFFIFLQLQKSYMLLQQMQQIKVYSNPNAI